MNWISSLVPPKIKSWIKPDVPDNLWSKCPSCGQMIFHRELIRDMYVCKYCSYHMQFPAMDRIENLFDSFQILDAPKVALDPLGFKDRRKYIDRLKDAKATTGHQEAVISALGVMNELELVCSVFNFQFIGGSMGTGVGEGIVSAINTAVNKMVPYIIFTASGGARMHEGILSLMQMPRTVCAVRKLKDAHLPYIVVMTNPTTGGVSASFAMVGDIHIAEPGAIIGFAGARVIKGTIKQDLPAGFQTAEYLLEHGMIDMIVPRTEIRARLTSILKMLRKV